MDRLYEFSSSDNEEGDDEDQSQRQEAAVRPLNLNSSTGRVNRGLRRANSGLHLTYKRQLLEDIDAFGGIERCVLKRIKRAKREVYRKIDSDKLRNFFNWLKLKTQIR
jgi:hypothetical protein